MTYSILMLMLIAILGEFSSAHISAGNCLDSPVISDFSAAKVRKTILFINSNYQIKF